MDSQLTMRNEQPGNAQSIKHKHYCFTATRYSPLLFLFMLCLLLYSQLPRAGELTLQPGQSNDFSIFSQADWLIDTDHQYRAETLINAAKKFKPYSAFPASFNDQQPAMWLRFKINNPGDKAADLVLTSRESVELGNVVVYTSTGQQLIPRAMHQLPHHFTVYSTTISISPHSSQNVLVYWPANIQPPSLQLFKLMPTKTFYQQSFRHLAVAYATVGIIFSLMIYNLFLLIYTREMSYAYYTLYVAFAGIFFSLHDEVAHQLLDSSIIGLEFRGKLFWWSIMPASLGLLLFSRDFLNTKVFLPVMDHALQGLVIVSTVFVLCGLLMDYSLLRTWSVLLSIIIFIFLLAAGLLSWYRKQQQARLYVVSFMPLFSMAFLAALNYLILDNPVQSYIYMDLTRLAVILSLILLSIGLARRIQELKKQRLQYAAEARAAQESADLKGQFLAHMSHEIRTPINGVIGMAEIIKENADKEQDRHTADILLNSADDLLAVVNDILDLSKIEAGKLRIIHESFSIGHVFSLLGTVFHEVNKNPNIELSLGIEGSLPNFLIGDQLRLKQVLNNLLSNAFKFTEKGQIQLICRRIDNSSSRQTLYFSIKDTGIGIDEEIQEKLFHPYEQSDKSSTRKYGGTGLGLSISKQLVELMGGQIGVKSQPNVGSEFWFTLSFDIDQPREALLAKQRKQIQGKKIALFFTSESYGNNELQHLKAIGAQPSLHLVRHHQPINDIGDADVVVASDLIGERLQGLLKQCHDAQTPVVVTRTNYNHVDEAWFAAVKAHFIYLPLASIDMESILVKALSGVIFIDAKLPLTPTDEQQLPSLRILIAEDNITNQIVIKSLLDKLHQHITLVSNGKEALTCYQQQGGDFDLILMDCEMPVMDGYSATKAIRQFETSQQLSPVTIFALTAHAMDENYQHCLEVGMNNVVIKPVKIDALRNLIASLSPIKAEFTG